ncbi:MAG: Maf family protein [Candidatus Enterenecus sp.]
MDIILASQSPRRRELLGQMGLKGFKVTSPEVDEEIDGNLPPAQIVEELSLRKATAVAEHADEDDLIIAADTIVVLDGAVLGKPADEREAFAMLTALSGNRHHVYTGVTVIQGDRTVTQHEVTAVTFRELEPGEIDNYIATGEPMDKAGAYGIQGLGSLLVSGIDGDYFNVMGLPVYRLGRILAGFGLDLLEQAAR